MVVDRDWKTGGLPHLFRRDPRVQAGSSNAAARKVEDAEGGDQRGRAAAAPASEVSGRGDVIHPLAEPSRLVLHDQHGASRQRRDVATAAAAGKPHQRPAAAGPGGVEVPLRIDLGPADKPHVHSPLLEEAHHVIQSETGYRPGDVRRITHGVDETLRRPVADDTVLEQADRIRCMGRLGQPEAEQRQAHADEDDLAVADLAGGSDHHQLAAGVGRDHGAKLAAAASRRSRTRSRSRAASPMCRR